MLAVTRHVAALLLLTGLALTACSSSDAADGGPVPGEPCSTVGQELCGPVHHLLCTGGRWAGLGDPCDAGVDAGLCPLPVIDRSCTVSTDCTVGVRHATRCGGIEQLIGIRTTELARFQAADTACVAASPIPDGGCGLPPDIVTDDGRNSRSTTRTLGCSGGMCVTGSNGPFCEPCLSQQVCAGGNGGCFAVDAGRGPSWCVDIPADCASCDCLGPDACAGTCVAVVPGTGAFCSCAVGS